MVLVGMVGVGGAIRPLALVNALAFFWGPRSPMLDNVPYKVGYQLQANFDPNLRGTRTPYEYPHYYR